MKGKLKRILTLTVIFIFILSLFSVLYIGASASADIEPIIVEDLIPDSTKAAESNWFALEDALAEAYDQSVLNGKASVTVQLPANGTYYIGKDATAAALKIRPNTVIDLNGSTLKRSGSMGNMFQCCDGRGYTSDATGYTLCNDIAIKNGVLDGTDGDPTNSANLVNFGHASGIILENLDITNGRGGHLVEFTGCENIYVKSCTFDGFLNDNLTDAVEALQLDICASKKTGGQEWNGIYCGEGTSGADNTPCRNVRIENCHFFDYPSAIGNHKGVKGVYTDNVVITNNYFENTLNSNQPAIWAYNFSNSTIEDNRIFGNYAGRDTNGNPVGGGIQISGGKNITVQNNEVSLEYASLYLTVASASYVPESGGERSNQFISNCKVLNNSFTTSGSVPTVCAYASSHISEFSGNTVIASQEKAVTFSTNSNTYSTNTKADLIKNNIITSTGTSDTAYGLHLATASVGTVSGNKITSKAHSIQASSDSVITAISSNTVSSANADGIYVTKSTVEKITGNTVSNCKVDSIAVINSSTASYVSSNKITNSGNDAIRIANSTATNITSNVINTAGKNGINVTLSTAGKINSNSVAKCKANSILVNSGKATYIANNKISSSTGDAILVYGSTVTTVSGNTVASSVANAITVSKGSTSSNVISNTVNTAGGMGIYVSDSTVTKINSNTVSGCKGDSIAVKSSGKASYISSNKITNASGNAIRVSGTVATVSNNVVSVAKDCGIYVSDGTVTNVTGNYLNKCANSGIKTTSSAKSVIKKIYGNAVFNSTDYGIRLNNSSSTVQIGNNATRCNKPDAVKNNGKTSSLNKAGWVVINGKYFYFNSRGISVAGWANIKNSKGVAYKYYFDKYGQRLTGWQDIKNSKGVTYRYYLGGNGVMRTGWQDITNSKGNTYRFYFGANGVMRKGWQSIKNSKGVAYKYYFYSNGVMAQNTSVKIGTKTYKFNKYGVCTNA